MRYKVIFVVKIKLSLRAVDLLVSPHGFYEVVFGTGSGNGPDLLERRGSDLRTHHRHSGLLSRALVCRAIPFGAARDPLNNMSSSVTSEEVTPKSVFV